MRRSRNRTPRTVQPRISRRHGTRRRSATPKNTGCSRNSAPSTGSAALCSGRNALHLHDRRSELGHGRVRTQAQIPPQGEQVGQAAPSPRRRRGSAAGACAGRIRSRTPVELVATPEAGYEFVGWIGCPGSEPKCELSLAGPTEVTAVFLKVAKEGPKGKEGQRRQRRYKKANEGTDGQRRRPEGAKKATKARQGTPGNAGAAGSRRQRRQRRPQGRTRAAGAGRPGRPRGPDRATGPSGRRGGQRSHGPARARRGRSSW